MGKIWGRNGEKYGRRMGKLWRFKVREIIGKILGKVGQGRGKYGEDMVKLQVWERA